MGNQVMRNLDDKEIRWCVIMLGTTQMSYKEIATPFLSEFPYFEDHLDNEIKVKCLKSRLKDYKVNKRQKYYAEIQELRAESISTSQAFMRDENWREDERQEAYDEIKSIAHEMRETTDADQLNSLKHASDQWWRIMNAIGNYDKHLLNIENLEKSGGAGHGIIIPETVPK